MLVTVEMPQIQFIAAGDVQILDKVVDVPFVVHVESQTVQTSLSSRVSRSSSAPHCRQGPVPWALATLFQVLTGSRSHRRTSKLQEFVSLQFAYKISTS